jgi:hypothetical protein
MPNIQISRCEAAPNPVFALLIRTEHLVGLFSISPEKVYFKAAEMKHAWPNFYPTLHAADQE